MLRLLYREARYGALSFYMSPFGYHTLLERAGHHPGSLAQRARLPFVFNYFRNMALSLTETTFAQRIRRVLRQSPDLPLALPRRCYNSALVRSYLHRLRPADVARALMVFELLFCPDDAR